MSCTPGTRFGPYEVTSILGRGGMGEVYRARDGRLDRDVALKVLPSDLTVDADRLLRFKREAQVLASLNHHNIAAIYGLEEGRPAGSELPVEALVLELVEGPTLADCLAGGPLPLDEARAIAMQIAAALESAHERGIVHRDLKPANVKIRPDGTVKVLDFGLAKAWEPPSPEQIDVSAPTFASPAMTRAGIILGTAAYMSPEQARGAPVDKRTDVWAFGCVLFEMLAGRHVFGGAGTVSDAIAAVLRSEPDWQALPKNTPPHIRSLLKRCLEKDSRRRLRDIGDAGLFLADSSDIVGVVGDAVYTTPREGMLATMYVPVAQQPPATFWPTVLLTINAPGRRVALERNVAAALTQADPTVGITFGTFDQLVEATVTQERLIAMLSAFFGGLALLLAAVGLYGVVAHAVRARQTEIGLRMALGAAPSSIVRLVFHHVGVFIAAGLAFGLAGSLWAVRFVEALLFHLGARDPLMFAGAAVVLVAVGVLAAWMPARRAARLDPATVLREG